MSEGKKNDQGKAPIHFLTREFIEGVAQAQAFGARKYGDYNFCNGLKHTRVLDAAFRHLFAYAWGEDIDPESGLPHIFLAGANLNMLSYMVKHHPQLDDRHKSESTLEDTLMDHMSKNIDISTEQFVIHTRKEVDEAVKKLLDNMNQDSYPLKKDSFLKFGDKK